MSENRPRSQQAKAFVQVTLRLKFGKQLPCSRDLLLGFVEVSLHSDALVRPGYLTKTHEKLRVTANRESGRQNWPHQVRLALVHPSNVFDAHPRLFQRELRRSIAHRVRRISVHIALAHKSTLSLPQADIRKDTSRFRMTGAIVRRRRDPLPQKSLDAALVCFAGVNRICEASFVREGDFLEPVEDV